MIVDGMIISMILSFSVLSQVFYFAYFSFLNKLWARMIFCSLLFLLVLEKA